MAAESQAKLVIRAARRYDRFRTIITVTGVGPMGARVPTLSRRRWLQGAASILASPSVAWARAERAAIRFGLTPVFLTSDLELLGGLQTYLQRSTGMPVTLITNMSDQK